MLGDHCSFSLRVAVASAVSNEAIDRAGPSNVQLGQMGQDSAGSDVWLVAFPVTCLKLLFWMGGGLASEGQTCFSLDNGQGAAMAAHLQHVQPAPRVLIANNVLLCTVPIS